MMVREVAESLFKDQINDGGRLLFFTRVKGLYHTEIDWKLEYIIKEFTSGVLEPNRKFPFLFR